MSEQFSISSELAVSAEALWRHAVSPVDINAEFRPLLQMRFPPGMEDVTEGWTPSSIGFRSWILLGGVLPVDYDDLRFTELEPGRYFQERSTMLTQAFWSHRREITPLPGGARITDRVEFSPRATVLTPLFEKIFPLVFRYRHRNLRRMYGRLITEG